jgi:predicted Zn-dependent protease
MKQNQKPLRKILLTLIVALAFLVQLHASAYALSIDEETEMGQKFVMEVRKQLNMLDDDFANSYINDLGQYLTGFLETKPFQFHFYIAQSNSINAFAGPGGQVFVFTGLIREMDNADELAAVMSHEIGHVSARHISQQIQQSKVITLATIAGVLASMLIGGNAGSALATGSMAAGVQKQLGYSREDERQADDLGFKYMEKSGFDPRGMISTLKKLEEVGWSGAQNVPTYLLDHPGGAERISTMEIMMKNYTPRPANRTTSRFRQLFPFFKAVVLAKSDDPQDGERIFRKELERNPDSAVAHFGLGVLYKEQQEYPKALEQLEKAFAKKPEMVPIITAMAETYQQQGKDGRAIQILQKALRVNDRDKTALLLLGMSYQNLGDYENSIVFFERLTSMPPVKDEVYYDLGMSYGKEGKLAVAHYNFGVYFKRSGMLDKARFHFKTALELAGSDQMLVSKIKAEMESMRHHSHSAL